MFLQQFSASNSMNDFSKFGKTLKMKVKVMIHEAEEGGYWAEVPALPGCVTQGETMDELILNIHEAVEGCLSVEIEPSSIGEHSTLLELAI